MLRIRGHFIAAACNFIFHQCILIVSPQSFHKWRRRFHFGVATFTNGYRIHTSFFVRRPQHKTSSNPIRFGVRAHHHIVLAFVLRTCVGRIEALTLYCFLWNDIGYGAGRCCEIIARKNKTKIKQNGSIRNRSLFCTLIILVFVVV